MPAAVSTITPNMAKTLVFNGWMSYPDRYERMQHAVILSGSSNKVRLFTNDFVRGGVGVPFGADLALTLTFDGKSVATASVKAADKAVAFDVDLSGLAEGWYLASVQGLDASWSVLDYGVYVRKGASALAHALMPVTTASHELIFEGQGRYQTTWVPTRFEPVTVPYPARAFPDHPAIPARKDLVITSLAVPRPGDLYRPAVTKDGVWTTANRENYFYFDFEQGKPLLPMLDGPRGKGNIVSPVHLEVGSAAPGGVLRGNVYFIESWRFGKVTPDGTVVTLAGYRHKDVASYWQDPTSAELIGDWSSIPVGRRGFAQPWGMAWDPRTLGINETAAPIPSEGNEKPHIYGPVAYISDTYHNRVLKLQFDARAHAVPPKVTEFIIGLNQPWDVIAVGVELYVSDRMNNAIKVFDMDTGALVKTIPVTQPEGMALLDGWLYYASVKSKSIRKINLATGENLLISDPTVAGSVMSYHINNNSRYMKIAVSDGSFGPRGMIAYTTWSNSYYGYPILIDGATGKMIDWIATKSGEQVRGMNPPLGSYSSAVGIGHGRMLFGTAEDGLHVVSEALPTDPVVDAAKYKAGREQWQAKGYGLTHGYAGYGFYGLPLPWGVTPEIDYFLTANLHGGGLPPGPTPLPPPAPTPSVSASPTTAAFGNVVLGVTSAAKTIVVSNGGTGAATNMSYPAAPAKFAKSGTCSGATLNPGASCTLVFTYTPTATVTDTTTYTVTGGGVSIPVLLSGTGVSAPAASLTASPTSHAFGNVTVGQSSAPRTITVTNGGAAAAGALAMSNGNAAEFVVSANTCGSSLAAGASCSLGVTYAPNGTGADSANLSFTFNGGSPVQVALSGTGVAPAAPNVSASPTSLAFGNVTVGQVSAPQTITVSNTGTAAAANMASPSAPAGFNRAGTCGAATLNAGASCTVIFTFSPSAAAPVSATYTITGGGSTMPIALAGAGTAAAAASLSASPTSLAFGTVAPGASSTPQPVTLTNTGNAAANGLTLSNGNAAEFVVSSNTCGTSLAAGASCSLNVAYTPTGIGIDTSTLTFAHAGGPAVEVSLSGAGGPPPVPNLAAIPASVAFGNVTVGTSASQAILLRNTGGAAATGVAVSGAGARFRINAGTCSITLEAGASCTLGITYEPTAA
ncbi:MAG: choice-of-anchor D domain-containing protein, partial [Burkholderiales bacterium]|nr:choice-of-anchor D domain-containing protein [Burkholderiales bacterium]